MKAWFISDLHLKTQEERNGKILLRFLRSLKKEEDLSQTHFYLLGDIFDLWIGSHSYFAKQFPDILKALKDLVDGGAKVVYIEGNHDVHVEGYFQKFLGVEVHVEAQYVELDGLTVRLEHGDLINLNDVAYLRYRSIIRNPFIKPLGDLLPGAFWSYIGNKASQKSRSRSGNYQVRNAEGLKQMICAHTPRAYQEKPFDVIISGHMHVYVDETEQISGRSVRTINLGSWFENTIKVLCIEGGKPRWVEIHSE